MKNASTIAIEQKADAQQYSDDELISIKTTLNLPYYSSSADYERAYGSININGQDYEYVKRRVFNDTLELLCLPNHTKTKLQSLTNHLAQSATDGQTSVPGKSNTVTKIFFPDFFQPLKSFTSTLVADVQSNFFTTNTNFISSNYTQLHERPPQPMQAVS